MNTRSLLILTALGALSVAPFLAPAEAHADPIDDVAFLSTLADHGIDAGTGAAGLIRAGHAVCTDLAAGDTAMGAAAKIAVANPNLDLDNSAYFVGVAIGAYCEWLAPTSWSTSGTERA